MSKLAIRQRLSIMGEMKMDGSDLKELRKRLGYSQQRLADELDVQRPTVSAWETSKERMSRILELAMRALEAGIDIKTTGSRASSAEYKNVRKGEKKFDSDV